MDDEIKGFIRITYTYCYPQQALGDGDQPKVIYRDLPVYRDRTVYRSSDGLGFFGGFMFGTMF